MERVTEEPSGMRPTSSMGYKDHRFLDRRYSTSEATKLTLILVVEIYPALFDGTTAIGSATVCLRNGRTSVAERGVLQLEQATIRTTCVTRP